MFGPSLRNASAKVNRVARGSGGYGQGGSGGGSGQGGSGGSGGRPSGGGDADPWAADSPGGYSDEPPF